MTVPLTVLSFLFEDVGPVVTSCPVGETTLLSDAIHPVRKGAVRLHVVVHIYSAAAGVVCFFALSMRPEASCVSEFTLQRSEYSCVITSSDLLTLRHMSQFRRSGPPVLSCYLQYEDICKIQLRSSRPPSVELQMAVRKSWSECVESVCFEMSFGGRDLFMNAPVTALFWSLSKALCSAHTTKGRTQLIEKNYNNIILSMTASGRLGCC